MNSENQPAFSVFNFGSKIETIFETCEKDNLLDSMWLFSNVPWSNHDNKNVNFSIAEPSELYYISLNGYDTKSAEIKKVTFDNVLITALHGFAGNSYTFIFKLGETVVLNIAENLPFGYDYQYVKNKFIEKLESKIKSLNYQIAYANEAIENIKQK